MKRTNCLKGWTPAHFAAARDHMDALNLLIDCGANLNRKENEGKNCFDLIVENENIELL